jgi:hypothetical protein
MPVLHSSAEHEPLSCLVTAHIPIGCVEMSDFRRHTLADLPLGSKQCAVGLGLRSQTRRSIEQMLCYPVELPAAVSVVRCGQTYSETAAGQQ